MTALTLKTIGEDAAARYLQQRGMRVIERNYRTRFGEIDIVAMKGRCLVFAEVKARKAGQVSGPVEAVGFRKQQKLRRLAEMYIAVRAPEFLDCRFDVVGVTTVDGRIELTHVENAF